MRIFFTTVCNAVRNNYGNDPDGFLIDFETAATSAIWNILPQTNISGCFFHLSSNLWKHTQRAGLQECYMNDPQFGLQLRIIATFAFVPHRMCLTPSMNFVLLFEISLMEMLIKCLTISRILTLVVFVGMPKWKECQFVKITYFVTFSFQIFCAKNVYILPSPQCSAKPVFFVHLVWKIVF